MSESYTMEGRIDSYELSLWSHKDEFLRLLKGKTIFEGQAYNTIFTRKIDGGNELTFSIPLYIYDCDSGKLIENPLWALIFGEKKIRLIRNRGESNESIFDFVIKTFQEIRDNDIVIMDVTCKSYALYELNKIGLEIVISEDNNIGICKSENPPDFADKNAIWIDLDNNFYIFTDENPENSGDLMKWSLIHDVYSGGLPELGNNAIIAAKIIGTNCIVLSPNIGVVRNSVISIPSNECFAEMNYIVSVEGLLNGIIIATICNANAIICNPIPYDANIEVFVPIFDTETSIYNADIIITMLVTITATICEANTIMPGADSIGEAQSDAVVVATICDTDGIMNDVELSGNIKSLSSFVDDFSTALDDRYDYYNDVSIIDGELNFSNGGYLRSPREFSQIGSSILFKLVYCNSGSYMYFRVWETPAGNSLGIIINQYDEISYMNGYKGSVSFETYNSSVHKFFKIKGNNDGTSTYQYSTDAHVWNDIATVNQEIDICHFDCYSEVSNDYDVIIDNINCDFGYTINMPIIDISVEFINPELYPYSTTILQGNSIMADSEIYNPVVNLLPLLNFVDDFSTPLDNRYSNYENVAIADGALGFLYDYGNLQTPEKFSEVNSSLTFELVSFNPSLSSFSAALLSGSFSLGFEIYNGEIYYNDGAGTGQIFESYDSNVHKWFRIRGNGDGTTTYQCGPSLFTMSDIATVNTEYELCIIYFSGNVSEDHEIIIDNINSSVIQIAGCSSEVISPDIFSNSTIISQENIMMSSSEAISPEIYSNSTIILQGSSIITSSEIYSPLINRETLSGFIDTFDTALDERYDSYENVSIESNELVFLSEWGVLDSKDGLYGKDSSLIFELVNFEANSFIEVLVISDDQEDAVGFSIDGGNILYFDDNFESQLFDAYDADVHKWFKIKGNGDGTTTYQYSTNSIDWTNFGTADLEIESCFFEIYSEFENDYDVIIDNINNPNTP